MADIQIRSIGAEELERFLDAEGYAFQEVPDEEDVARERLLAEPDRYFVALEGEDFVGTAGACSTMLTVPGPRSVPAAGITAVGVRPSHRRQGINTALIGTLLDQAADRGEPLAFLWASESSIYRRFGFGMASMCVELEVPTAHGRFVPGIELGGRIRLMSRADALPAMRPVHERVAARRPGMIAIEDRWWTWLFVERKGDKELPPFYVVHEDDDGMVDGYAEYRFKHEWIHSVSHGEIEVRQLIAETSMASAALWRYLLDMDLVETVKAWDRPLDEELLRFAAEPRRLNAMVADGLWVRLIDVPEALGARGYGGDGRVVFDVRDPFRPRNSGRYELIVGDGEGRADLTDTEPEIACDVAALGAAYLGGSSFRELARVQQVRELVPGALARADAMFDPDPSPWFGFAF
jgi:predicted acetyltransferase